MEISIRVTRRELINIKRKIYAAEKGLELLKIKRSSLILEFFNLLKEIKDMRINLIDTIKKSQESLKIAEALSGSAVIEKIAEEQREVNLSIDVKNVMGIIVSNAKTKNEDEIKNDIVISEMPTPVYDAKKYYNKFLSSLLNIAEKERTMKNILKETYNLNRRVNSLEYIVIPKWINQRNYISERLEDNERDRIVAIKFFKRLKS